MSRYQEQEVTFKERLAAIQEAEYNRQIKRLLTLGFHKELELSLGAYKGSLPQFSMSPLEYVSISRQLCFPVIVDPRVPLQRQSALAEIQDAERVDDIADTLTSVPRNPYLAYMKGPEGLHSSVAQRMQVYADDIFVQSSLLEVVSFFLQYGDRQQEGIKFFAPGSQLAGEVPFILKSNPVQLGGAPRDMACNNMGVMLRGKKIITTPRVI